MALFCSSLPASHDSVTVSQHVQQGDPENEEARWNPAIIYFNFFFFLQCIVGFFESTLDIIILTTHFGNATQI